MKKVRIVHVIGLLLPVLLASPAFGDVTADLKQAEGLYGAGQHAQAEQAYLKVIKGADPNQPQDVEAAFNARRKLPLVYLATEQLPQAQAAVRELLSKGAYHERLPHALHEIVEQAKAAGKMAQAGQLYESILTEQPEHPQAVWLKMGLAIASAHAGDDQAVDTALQNIITEHQDDDRAAEALGQTAWAYRKLNQHDKARTVYQYVVDNWPDKDRAIFSQRGIVLSSLELQDQETADQATEELLQKFADDENMPVVAWALAKVYRDKEDWDRTRALCEYLLSNHPQAEESIWAQQALIFEAIAKKDHGAIKAGAERLLARFSAHKNIASALYGTARKLNRLDDATARQLYQQIVDKHPNHDYAPFAKVNLGQIKLRQGDETGAEAIFQQVLADYQGHPRLAETIHLMAEGYFDQGVALEKENAERVGSREYAQIVREQGRSEAVKHLYQCAIAKWRITIEQLPAVPHQTAQAWYFTGVTYRRHLGEPEKAIPYYEKVVQTWPDYEYAWSARSMLATCYEHLMKAGTMTKAQAEAKMEQAYQAVVDRYSDCSLAGPAYLRLGLLKLKKNQPEQAAACFTTFLQKYPQAPQWPHALVYLATTYEQRGKPDAAAELYRSYLNAADPEDPRIKLVQAKLDKETGVQQ